MSREVRVGLMFALSVTILGAAIYFLGSFQEMLTYKVKFNKVNGLAEDSPVQFNGVPIGRVSKIELADEVQAGFTVPVFVTIAVHRSAKSHIRTSTLADIKAVGILGDKMILLVTPDYGSEELAEDEFIKTIPKALDVDRLLEQGNDLVTDVGAITKELKGLLTKLGNKDGSVLSLIEDKQWADNVKAIVSRALTYMEQEENVLALLLKDPAFSERIRGGVDTLLSDAAALTNDYRNADGLLPSLMKDQAFKQDVEQRVIKALEGISAYVDRLSQSRGLLYRITEDEAYGERVAANLEKASFHLASILEKIDQGQGSASLMLNDPSLYEGLYEVVYGLEHSGLSKWYLQRKRKKGAKLKEERKNEEKDSP